MFLFYLFVFADVPKHLASFIDRIGSEESNVRVGLLETAFDRRVVADTDRQRYTIEVDVSWRHDRFHIVLKLSSFTAFCFRWRKSRPFFVHPKTIAYSKTPCLQRVQENIIN